MPDSSSASVRLVSSPAEFAALRSEWNAVVASEPRLPVFCRHEWVHAAWQWQRQAARLYLLCHRDGARLVAVLPLVIQESVRRGVRIRELGFLTVPDTQACDMVVATRDRSTASAAFAFELARRRDEWDVLRLEKLGPESAAGSALCEALERAGFAARRASAPGNPFIPLDSSWTAFYATRSRRLKKANNLAANRLKLAGEVRVDWLAPGTGDAADLARFVQQAMDLSAASWKSGTGNSLDEPGPGAFIRQISDAAFRERWLSIWLLSLAGRPLAMEYQLVADGNVYALRSDFDRQFDALSPGTHLNRCLLERLFGRGLHRYYMGPGNNAYKHRWTEDVEPVEEVTVYGRSIVGRGLAVWETRLRPMATRLRSRLTARTSGHGLSRP